MAKRKVDWTIKANFERKEILDYWIRRNKSNLYSIKLNKLFIEAVKKIAANPTIGRTSDFPDVRVKILRNYLIFYEYNDEILKVLSLWDGNRDDKIISVK